MKILGLETSANVSSVALVDDDVLICEYTLNYKLTHSQTLMPMIEEVCKRCELELDSIDAVAVASGPGSFTGLRIGAATAKGLAHGLNKPIIPVSTLDALAYNVMYTDKLICPIMDARRNQVYTALYQWEDETFNRIMEPSPMEIGELLEVIDNFEQEVIFLGDGVPVYKQNIMDGLDSSKSCFAPANNNIQRAASVASMGIELYKQGKHVKCEQYAPEYLRKSQAEREYEARKGK